MLLTINKKLVKKHFDQAAKWYDEVTPVQGDMAEASYTVR